MMQIETANGEDRGHYAINSLRCWRVCKKVWFEGYHEIFVNKEPQINADERRFVIAYLRLFAFICGFLDYYTKRFYTQIVETLSPQFESLLLRIGADREVAEG